MDQIDRNVCVNTSVRINGNYQPPTFQVKHIHITGEYSCFVFLLDKVSLKHIVLQSVVATKKDDVLQKITRKPWCDSEYLLQFVQEIVSRKYTPIIWIMYETGFCTLKYYMGLIKYTVSSPGQYFAKDDNIPCLERIYADDLHKYSFNIRNVAIHFIISIFDMVEYLNSVSLNYLFIDSNIVITDYGKLKLFPAEETNSNLKKNKDPEDIIIDLLASQEDVGSFMTFLKEIHIDMLETWDQTDFSRNLFVAGLVSVRLLFRNWSPFRISDLPDEMWKHFNVKVNEDSNINQDLWLTRTMFDPMITDGFIIKGLMSSCFNDDETIKELTKFLAAICQPRRQRMNDSEIIRSLKSSTNFQTDMDALLTFLNKHYLTLLCGNKSNLSNMNSNNRKRSCGENVHSDAAIVEDAETNNAGCGCGNEREGYEGISNWMEDSQSFLQLTPNYGRNMSENSAESEESASCLLSSERNVENIKAKLDFPKSASCEESSPNSTVFNFDLSTNESPGGCDAADKVFPIFKTSENDIFIQYMSSKAKKIKLFLRKTPKPIITCYPKGHCTLQYEFDKLEMELVEVPLKYINNDADNVNSSNRLQFRQESDLEDPYNEEMDDRCHHYAFSE